MDSAMQRNTNRLLALSVVRFGKQVSALFISAIRTGNDTDS